MTTYIEVYCKNELAWGGSVEGSPRTGDLVAVNRPGEEPLIYLLSSCVWNVVEDQARSVVPPRFEAVEIDRNTGKAKESIIKPATIIQ